MKKNTRKKDDKTLGTPVLPGDPVYAPKEDIYNKAKKEPLPEDEVPVDNTNISTTRLDDDLDIPGAELDDANEMIGEEDEENNYYSLGGDSHENLEEDQG